MNTPDTREIAEVKTSRTGLGRKTARLRRTNRNGSATPSNPRMLLGSETPGLAPESVPDCDDDVPIGLAARKRGEFGRSHADYADRPATDPNSSLIDELERILRGDFAGEDDVSTDDPRPRYPSFGADPLSLLDPDPEDAEDDDIVADFAAPFERAAGRLEPLGERVVTPSTGRSPLRPAAGVRSPVVFDDGDRDDFAYFDEGPPRTADFWHAEAEPAASARQVKGRRRRRLSRGYLTVSGLLLLVAAGGIYSTMQFRGDPEGALPDQTGVTAANALGGVAAEQPRLVNTTVETPPPMAAMADTPEGAVAPATPEGGVDPAIDPVVADVPAMPAVEAEPEPRIVPLFRTPDDGAVAAAEPAGAAAEDPAAIDPPVEVAIAEPAGAATPPAAIAETPVVAAAGGARQATITDWVNLRADNSMNARVILVIPMGATVELIGCPGWCEVIYDGTRGFVGPDFVDPL